MGFPMTSKIFYHGTSRANLAGIMRDGLKPHAAPGADKWAMDRNPMLGAAMDAATTRQHWRTQSVYITKRGEVAAWFAKMTGDLAHDKGALLRITIPEGDKVEMFPDEQASPESSGDASDNPMKAYRYCGAIPAAWIKEVTGATRAKLFDEAGPIPGSDPLAALFA